MTVPEPTGIVWHHSASGRHDRTCEEIDASARRSTKLHRPRFFPYDFGIDSLGHVTPGTIFGRRLDKTGAHCIGYNGYKNTPRYVGIGLIGNFTLYSPSVQQVRALLSLTIFLSTRYLIPFGRIKLHNELSDTRCPGDQWDPRAVRTKMVPWIWTETEDDD